MLRKICTIVALAILVIGCGEYGSAAKNGSSGKGYYEVKSEENNRIYITASADVARELKAAAAKGAEMPMPYTRTLIGAGPNRETLVFEVDKKDAGHARELMRQYFSKQDDFYREIHKDKRIYVVGNVDTWLLIDSGAEMPYTRTLIGAGPNRETLVFEVEKKDADFVENLMAEYYQRHPFYAEMERHSRIYVMGTRAQWEKFLAGEEMPYTRTFIGAGPGRKTVVVEVDKKNPAQADRLTTTFNRKHGSKLGK